MPSLTPLHETYCRWDDTPPSQADLMEGFAQLMTTPKQNLYGLMHDIQTELLSSFLRLSEKRVQRLQHTCVMNQFNHAVYEVMNKSGSHLFAPLLRQILEKYPNLREKSLSPITQDALSILNGVAGDYFLLQQNPLALPMVLYDHYGAIQKGDVGGRIVIFVHGLCLSHRDWSNSRFEGIGERLLAQRDYNTMLYLNYNTGRRISANGRSLSNLLEDLIERNPRIQSIDLIGHSMGGLVCRSALFYGKQDLKHWFHRTQNLVCIGSPHHGAALERFGFRLQESLGHFPLVKIARHIVNFRSNGILDLRYGSVRDDDWEHMPARIGSMDDCRKPAPLPSHISAFFIAGTMEFKTIKNKTLSIIGDYLVSVQSALGEHPNPRFNLNIPDSHKAVFYGLNHFNIQYHPSVAEQITRWLYPDPELPEQNFLHRHVVDLGIYELDTLLEMQSED
ncbi:alpha/beta fold hydrolase [Acinetobacter sp. MB5]|uniref:alpha/beta fold hydrolase n=1 Tax=Acinetobacter sp. MB5 TaxID=2069438 RepID=UPI000DD024CE|nr:alpha/beta fold hydrolase [Acinetobacter sp. MB5]